MPEPRRKRPVSVPAVAADLPADEASLASGEELYRQYCRHCHGAGGGSEGAMPNLQRATDIVHRNFADIVLGGSREPQGMPSYEGLIDAEQLRLIQAYVVSQARETLADDEDEAAGGAN